jgi:hypothetical protein
MCFIPRTPTKFLRSFPYTERMIHLIAALSTVSNALAQKHLPPQYLPTLNLVVSIGLISHSDKTLAKTLLTAIGVRLLVCSILVGYVYLIAVLYLIMILRNYLRLPINAF